MADTEVPLLSAKDLAGLLRRAWDDARARPVPADARCALGALRSQLFVAALGDALAAHYAPFPDVSVLARGRRQGPFAPREEFLFDLLVARMGMVTSPVHQASLPFIREPRLQVESEFAFDTRETLLDASKLVCGAAPQSLLVVPSSPTPENYLRPLAVIAGRVGGEMFVAFVPHPRAWKPSAPTPVLYRWVQGDWRSIEG